MKRQLIFAIALTGWTAPGAHAQAQGQGGSAGAPVFERHVVSGQAVVGGGRVMAGAVQTRITPDRPYAAEAINETVQVLGDGNRIVRTSVTRVYRDSAGRTRRETLNDDGTLRTIAISDPVGHVSYTLDPKTKIAYKSGGNIVAAGTIAGTYSLTPTRQPAPTGSASGGGVGIGVGSGSGEGGGRDGYASLTRTGSGAGGEGAMTTVSNRARREELQPQNIEGVSATGTRTTTIIPPGEIGNAQEIRVVSEQWFADELQVLVATRHSDPRTGDTTYRLRNILRAEPDPSLFLVPSDYTVQDRSVR